MKLLSKIYIAVIFLLLYAPVIVMVVFSFNSSNSLSEFTGFSFRFYMEGIVENDAVKTLALNGVYPSAENIRNRSYPIVTQFYAIHRTDNPNPNVKALIDWLLSEDGQTLIEKTGYVKIN